MSDWRSFIIVLALFAVLLSALATERFRPCTEGDQACRERAPWYTFPIARVLSEAQGQSSVRAKSPPAAEAGAQYTQAPR
jgi:hypothetical protein